MPNFSGRWGLPSSRLEKAQERKCRGRRPGGAVPCYRRLLGWIENVARRSTSWGDVDLAAFCAKTGYSREHATRELSRIRRQRTDLAFETKLRRRARGRRAAWGVIVCEARKLRYDRRSLFYTDDGKRLHNYTSLGADGEKIEPTQQLPTRARFRRCCDAPKPERIAARVCDNPFKKEDSFGIQQKDSYGARRFVAQSRDEKQKPRADCGRSRLARKAFSLLRRSQSCHYDNCKVTFSARTAYRYALRALVEGHDQECIVRCYEDALFVCHGFAVDRAASTGKVVFFNPSSTILKARKLLAKDGLTREERVRRWYDSDPKRHSLSPFPIISAEEVRANSSGFSTRVIGKYEDPTAAAALPRAALSTLSSQQTRHQEPPSLDSAAAVRESNLRPSSAAPPLAHGDCVPIAAHHAW
jgi:hypothetical protein